jgi:predicted acyltransferase
MSATTQRFTALDVFRGATICLMIIVNTPGDGSVTFAPLHHARWDGFTPTDLVFPSFLFAVGNAMSFVMKRWAQMQTSAVLAKIFKRSFLIFLLGYLMYWFPFFTHDEGYWALKPISHTRIMGVLQRIALCYGIAALLLHFLKTRTVIILSVLFLLGYWLICYLFGESWGPYTLPGYAGLKLDMFLFGENHLYHGEGIAFDPEGILSTIPAIVNVVAGYLAGAWLQQKGKSYEAIARLMLAGFALLVIAYFWNFQFPINKKIWTSSFVLHTVGLDCLILSAIVYFIDIRGNARWTGFFEVAGKNPLAIYLLSELLAIIFYEVEVAPDLSLFRWIYLHPFVYAGPYWGSLLFAVSFMLVCWAAGYWMDKKKIYWRL